MITWRHKGSYLRVVAKGNGYVPEFHTGRRIEKVQSPYKVRKLDWHPIQTSPVSFERAMKIANDWAELSRECLLEKRRSRE